ncbi:PorP/SprF family type IX secretion system membrane protein [Flavobacterium xinjiangense]|jgi:type IX secretion system PorP/SprF family membrane protein|uniref:Type IX secretion system membrane protein, PorP/SprF family n=1 Tax=Flavobacterium xinjiangense TaxID=178356 RepID=A0A1M7KNZ2_9FLAO|nr:type IX secretion system membrane protein PorP/SprF [Flavobacterium xinjiangense]SHM67115.1 type IX secretion system membrane protein, PorP/SprF family [Flavobacterium xinjiangense]
MKKRILIIIFLFFIIRVSAQQDAEYTQYMYNMNVLNPAYATGMQSMLDIGTVYRTQWVGAVGAPKTLSVFAHMPVNKKIEIGFSLISDDIGDGAKKENNFYVDFAYVLQLNDSQRLSLGLKAGATSIQTNFNGFKFESSSPDFAFENVNILKPNIGIGAYYFNDVYYVGLSAPNLLNSKHIEERSGISNYGSENVHVFFTGGYVFTLSDSFKLKPAFMSKFVQGAPIAVDVSANVLYNDKFELGAAYRVGDAISALMNVKVTPSVRVGYAYDYTISNLGQFNSGTHEIFVLFNLDLLGKGYDKSPRFF